MAQLLSTPSHHVYNYKLSSRNIARLERLCSGVTVAILQSPGHNEKHIGACRLAVSNLQLLRLATAMAYTVVGFYKCRWELTD